MASYFSPRKRTLAGFLFCLFLAGSLVGLWAQSSGTLVYFPRFLYVLDLNSGIAIFNPTARDALVELALIDSNGFLVQTVPNPVFVLVPAKGQIARMATDLFGSFTFFDGTLRVRSDTTGLVVHYCTFDTGLTFIDGTPAPESSTSLIFPVVPGSTEGISLIDLLNPNSRPTGVELKLWSFNGDLLGRTTVQVPAGGFFSFIAGEGGNLTPSNILKGKRDVSGHVFPEGTSFLNASHITATSKAPNVFGQAQSVSGSSLFLGFYSRPTEAGDIDLAALNGLSLTQTFNSGAFPFFRTGSQNFSVLSLSNVEQASVDVTLTAMRNNGSSIGTRRVTIRPNGGFRAPLQSVFSSLGFSEEEGWILVQATGRVAGALINGRTDASAISAIALKKAPQFAFAFPQAVQGNGFFSEISVANPAPNTSNVEVFAISPAGATLARGQFSVGPGGSTTRRLNQILPELLPFPGGVVFVTASEAVFANLGLWTDSGSTLTDFAPGSVPSSYSPNPLTIFAVTGKVTLNDSPAAGFRVALSGPVSSVTTTAADGTYLFRDVPAGRYSMIVDQFGFEFIPAQVNFEITTTSKRQDFQGFTATNAIVVQPSSFLAGSGAATATVFGKDFNGTSEAFVGPVRLDTTFVDSTQLRIGIPGFLLAQPSRFEIIVITNGSGPDRLVSQPYPIVAFLNRPSLNSISTDGNIVEGNPGTSVRIGGLGFLPGAKVKVNGSSDGIEISLLNNSEIIAFVPSLYFQRGGIYPVTIENPYPANAESNIQLLTVFFPRPSIDEIFPKVTSVRLEDNGPVLNLEVLGFGFRRGAVVLINSVPVITTYCENDPFCLNVHLFARIPPQFLREAGFAEIKVLNPDPSLGGSATAILKIEGLQPTITSVFGGSATVLDNPPGFDMPVVINGTNFGTQTLVRIYPAGSTPTGFLTPVELISSTQLVTDLLVDFPDSLGEWIVQVMNPQPGGGISEPASFTITEGNFVSNPFLISLTPQVVAASGPGFTLTVNGTNFRNDSQINFYSTPLVTTFVSDRELRAEVSADLIHFQGRVPISVSNLDNGGTSNRLYLDIR